MRHCTDTAQALHILCNRTVAAGDLSRHDGRTFRPAAFDLKCLRWSLPVLVFSVLISALTLPTHKELMDKVRAAAATAGGSSSSSSSEEAWPLKGLDDARRMAQNAALVSDMPIRWVVCWQHLLIMASGVRLFRTTT